MKQGILLVGLLLCGYLSRSQDISTSNIEWSSISTFNASEGEWVEEQTSLTTYSLQRVVWRNSNGSTRKTFQIVEVMGTWTNISNDGKIQYEVTEGNYNG